jgi:hypothetical protein
MKFVTILLAPLLADALSNVAPGTFERRIKSVTSEDFDPTAGDNAALLYNNNDEVWVPQVTSPILVFALQYLCQFKRILTIMFLLPLFYIESSTSAESKISCDAKYGP